MTQGLCYLSHLGNDFSRDGYVLEKQNGLGTFLIHFLEGVSVAVTRLQIRHERRSRINLPANVDLDSCNA